MGAWGAGIFQNDVSDDVRTDYKNKLKLGRTDEDALKEILAENSDILNDDEDKYDFWFGLASVMSDLGRLTGEVGKAAIELIDNGGDLFRFEDDKSDMKKRKAALEKLREKLVGEQPERKKVPVAKAFVCPWKVNDIFVYRPEWLNKYVLIAVDKFIQCDAEITGLGDMLPVTFFKISDIYPETLENVDNALFLPNWVFEQKGLAEYRHMWFKSGFKKATAKFEYVGNFPFARPELIRYDKDEGLCYCEAWHRLDIVINEGIELLKTLN